MTRLVLRATRQVQVRGPSPSSAFGYPYPFKLNFSFMGCDLEGLRQGFNALIRQSSESNRWRSFEEWPVRSRTPFVRNFWTPKFFDAATMANLKTTSYTWPLMLFFARMKLQRKSWRKRIFPNISFQTKGTHNLSGDFVPSRTESQLSIFDYVMGHNLWQYLENASI